MMQQQAQPQSAVKFYNEKDIKPAVSFHKDEIDPPEEREYIILAQFTEESGLEKTFEIIIGRGEAWLWIRQNLDELLLTKSYILVSGSMVDDMATILDFLVYCQENDFFRDDSFDPYSFLKEEDEMDDEEEEDNQVTQDSDFQKQIQDQAIYRNNLIFDNRR